jgi:mono/diheme cytochrome c family protein
MNVFRPEGVLVALLLFAVAGPPARAEEVAADAHAVYQSRCAACHGGDRLGGIGPALLPENLGRLRKPEAAKVIAEGRPATQMPGFGNELDAKAVDALVSHIYAPLPQVPEWGMEEIAASRVALPPVAVDRPAYAADPLNLFVVVEAGDHHVTVLDGDRFEPIARVPTRYALHGGPKFTSDGRYVFWASRDGWVTKFDLWALAPVAEIRAGINTRNIAVSGDGKVIAVANYLPHSLVLLDARDLSPMKVIEVRDARGKQSSRVSAVYQAPRRKSFIAALKDVPEIWEVFYDENPPKVYSGLVHSYEKGFEEGLAQKGRFPVRRIATEEPLDDFFFDPPYRNLIGSSRAGGKGVVVNLDVGRPIATIDLPGLPHLGSGITWERDGTTLVATPNLKEPELSFIDTKGWRLIKRVKTPGPGFFLRSHAASRFAWGDAMMSPAKDTMYIVDKTSLEIARTLTPAPGKTAAHVEFDRSGRHAVVSIWELDGALVIYDAETFREVKRVPAAKPVGKYNVWNKITFSEGTSH